MTSNARSTERYARADPAPGLRPAGKVDTHAAGDSAGQCLNQNQTSTTGTPPHLRPYRRSFRDALGVGSVHYGKYYDPPPPDGARFGKVVRDLARAELAMYPPQASRFGEKQLQLQESIYRSHKLEPLGTRPSASTTTATQLPARITADPKFRFGKHTDTSEASKLLIFPVNDPYYDTSEHHQRYVRSHGSYAPGEQKLRGYNFAAHAIEPTTHRFGKPLVGMDKTGGSMKYDPIQSSATVLVRKVLEDHRDVTRDELGQPKNLGFGATSTLPPEFVYGRPSKADEFNAQRLLQGSYPEAELQPDPDLGRTVPRGVLKAHATNRRDRSSSSTKSHNDSSNNPATGTGTNNDNNNATPNPGAKSAPSGSSAKSGSGSGGATSELDPNMVFGVPTIRSDISKPKSKKVTDASNYGDEPKAEAVIYPSVYAQSYNVFEEDFIAPVTPERMKALMQKAGIELSPEQFEQVWAQAQTHATDGTQVCVHSFRTALEDLNL